MRSSICASLSSTRSDILIELLLAVLRAPIHKYIHFSSPPHTRLTAGFLPLSGPSPVPSPRAVFISLLLRGTHRAVYALLGRKPCAAAQDEGYRRARDFVRRHPPLRTRVYCLDEKNGRAGAKEINIFKWPFRSIKIRPRGINVIYRIVSVPFRPWCAALIFSASCAYHHALFLPVKQYLICTRRTRYYVAIIVLYGKLVPAVAYVA